MDEKKNPRVYIQELPSQSSFSTQRPIISRHESAAPIDLWSSEPQILKDTRLSKWFNYAYDAALCVAPVFLMVKICLVIYSSQHANEGTTLQKWLTEFNNQVSSCFCEKCISEC